MSKSHTITCITGLCGSGKTHYANGLGVLVVDDITDLKELPARDTCDSFAIIDITFMLADRAKVEKQLSSYFPKHSITWVFFENDPDKARRNVRHRSDGRRVLGAIDLYTRWYKPPADALKIWQPPIDESPCRH